MIVKLETMSEADNVFRIVGTQKYLTLTDEEIANAQVGDVHRDAHLDMSLVLVIANKCKSLIAEGLLPYAVDFEGAPSGPVKGSQIGPLSGSGQPARSQPEPAQGAPEGPQRGPARPGQEGPPTVAQNFEEAVEADPTHEALKGFGIDLTPKEDTGMPYLVNDEAGKDGSILSEEQISELMDYYGNGDRAVRVSIIKKLSGMPIRILSRRKDIISQDVREGIVRYILMKDGVQSNFVPADLANFMAEGQGDASTTRLLGRDRIKRTKGHVGEEFEETSAAGLLNLALEPKSGYVPSAEEFKRRN